MSRKATPNIDYTSRDYEAYRAMMLAKLTELMPEYTDHSQSDAGVVILECLANGLDICSLYTDVIANDVVLPTTQDRSMATVIAECLGYTPYFQTASITPQVFVLNSARTVDTIIPAGTRVATKDEGGVQLIFETLEDFVIPAGRVGNEVDEQGNYLLTVDVINATSINEDIIGSSNGASFQTFNLTYPKALIDSLEVYVRDSQGLEKWERVDSFFDTNIDRTSKVYTVSVDEFDICYINFGDGARGMIPPEYDNGIRAWYKIGGGSSGNVNANTIIEIKTSVPYVTETFNPVASTTLGRDKETLEEIKTNAPLAFKTRDRAVTLADYEDLIRINNKGDLYAIFNTKAIRNEEDHLECDMYFQMRPGYAFDSALIDSLDAFFEPRIMIGAHHTYSLFTPYEIDLSMRLIVDNDYSASNVQAQVDDYIKNVFFAFGEFTFGDSFVKTDLEAEVLNTIAGVRSLRIESPLEDIIHVEHEYEIITLRYTAYSVSGGM